MSALSQGVQLRRRRYFRRAVGLGVIGFLVLFFAGAASGQGSRRTVFKKKQAGSSTTGASSQRWIDQLNTMPEGERAARINGYAPGSATAARRFDLFPMPPSSSRAQGGTGQATHARTTRTVPAPRAIPVERPAVIQPAVVAARAYTPSAVVLRPTAVSPTVIEEARANAEALERARRQVEGQRVRNAAPNTIQASALFPGHADPARLEPAVADPNFVEPRDLVRRNGKLESFLEDCHDLSRRGLKYKFGSNDPRSGGLDCSGTVQFLLQAQDVPSVPRQSNLQYHWLEEKGTLKKVSRFTSSDKVLRDLKPGDLLFWKDTYNAKRSPNVTHVMIYMGRDSRSGKHMMFGARSSRASGVHGNPVDIFEFGYPFSEGKGKFIAYGSVPDLNA